VFRACANFDAERRDPWWGRSATAEIDHIYKNVEVVCYGWKMKIVLQASMLRTGGANWPIGDVDRVMFACVSVSAASDKSSKLNGPRRREGN
jgi:hypothetical protein